MIIMRRRRTRRRTLTLTALHFRLLQGVFASPWPVHKSSAKPSPKQLKAVVRNGLKMHPTAVTLLGFVVCYCLLFVVFVASCPFSCFVVLLCGSFADHIDIEKKSTEADVAAAFSTPEILESAEVPPFSPC